MVPESLGNKSHILPPGVVCDSCNNYFAGKVEKPVLESEIFKALRLFEEVPSKRGRFPTVQGLVAGAPVSIGMDKTWGKYLVLSDDPREARHVFKHLMAPRSLVVFPAEHEPPDERLFSRFLAKIGFEAVALRLVKYPEGLTYLVDEPQFDPVRNYARRGEGKETWPFSIRRIYPADHPHPGPGGAREQVVFEWDILRTEASEYYFVLAIFGVEFAINLGGAEITGYEQWLHQHSGRSPLYSDRGPIYVPGREV